MLSPAFAKKVVEYFTEYEAKTASGQQSGWYIPVNIQGQTITALMDTGSVVTLIGEQCIKKLGIQTQQCQPVTMKMANDMRQTVDKHIRGLVVTIGKIQVPVNALIVP